MPEKSSVIERNSDPGFWRELWQQARLVFRLLRDPEVPFYLKFLPFMAAAYVLLPFDLMPDLVPIIGQLDDVTLLLVGAKLFIELSPPQVTARHLAAIREKDGYVTVIEGEHTDIASGGDFKAIEESIIIEADQE